jgi:signal transduction histidine kinase
MTTDLFVVLTNRVIRVRFNDMIARSGQSYAKKIAPFLERYYQLNNGWDNVDELATLLVEFQDNPKRIANRITNNSIIPDFLFAGRDERLILFEGNKVLFDTDPNGKTSILNVDVQKYGVPIIVDGAVVGTVVAGSAIGFLTDNQSRFLREVNRILLWIAFLSIVAVLLVGITQSQSIIQPIQKLNQATRQIAKGDYATRIKINRNDEFGEMAQAFNDMAQELENQQALRNRSMADIAHELRTPLSILQIDLESMEDGLMEVTSENMRVLQNEVSHLRNLVEDLRILSRADAGEISIEHTKIELGSLIRDVIERQMQSARDKGVRLAFDLENEEIFVKGDNQRLSQVLINLLSNAVRHTPQGGSVNVTMKQQGKNEVLVSVADTGEGIPQADLPFLFDRFYRVEKSRSRDQGGSGLGLSIAKSLIEAHQGRIWVESKEGEGSTFKFVLPLTN